MKEHIMQLRPAPLRKIKEGKKTIELRLYDEKRKDISIGDIIKFINTDDTDEVITVCVKNLYVFDSFAELYKKLPLLQCGYTENTVTDAKPSDMEKYYSIEEQKKYGVLGIEISRPNGDTDETVCLLSK